MKAETTTKAYNPQPADTSAITIPFELEALIERIAQNVHDVWAKTRMEEGWTYGPKKDSDNLTTPCLVPYPDLPESEKEYDRNTAMETLKLIQALGYRIVPVDPFIDEQVALEAAVEDRLLSLREKDPWIYTQIKEDFNIDEWTSMTDMVVNYIENGIEADADDWTRYFADLGQD